MAQTYENDRIRVTFDPDRCVSADNCLRGLPQVFNGDRDPWIDVNGAGVDDIIRLIGTCPAAALSYELLG